MGRDATCRCREGGALRRREDARRRGQEAAHAMADWDWKKQVPRLIDLLEG